MSNLRDPEDSPFEDLSPLTEEEKVPLAKQAQIDLAEKLQTLWLHRMTKKLEDGTVSSTDMATLMRFLVANGWNLDPARLPQGLRDKLTSHLKPGDFDEEDGVVGKIA
jgi:hypothetical protein